MSTNLAEQFEEHRRHLRSVAHRMLGSRSEADDAVQEAWLRLCRADPDHIDNLGGWLTTVVARVCLDLLRARRARPEEPEPIVWMDAQHVDPESEAILADSLGLALLVVLETLAPSERLVFVLHDMFDVPFDEIAKIVGKTPAAARQMASRARRRVRGAPSSELGAQQEVVAAFLAAARGGDFEALLTLLDPEVEVRAELGPTATVTRGAASAAKGAITGAQLTASVRFVLVGGVPGYVSFHESGEPRALVTFTVQHGKITKIDVLASPERLRELLSL